MSEEKTFTVGQRVTLAGLAATQLNGTICVVVGELLPTGRVPVKVLGPPAAVAAFPAGARVPVERVRGLPQTIPEPPSDAPPSDGELAMAEWMARQEGEVIGAHPLSGLCSIFVCASRRDLQPPLTGTTVPAACRCAC